MVQIPAVFGVWELRESWNFVVDTRMGGTMFSVKDDCTYRELVAMAQGDFGLNNEFVDLVYRLPAPLIQDIPDTPPMFVTNDRQLRSLIELSRTHTVRLCISRRVEPENVDVKPEEYGYVPHGAGVDGDGVDGAGVDGAGVDGFGHNFNGDGVDVKVEDGTGCLDEDYSAYGRVASEDEDDIPTKFDLEAFQARCSALGQISALKSSDNLAVNKSFPSKEHLLEELRRTAVLGKFGYKVRKSTPDLFLATCRVKGCKWRIRAMVKNEQNIFWVTKYERIHTCSVFERSSFSRICSPRFYAKLFLEGFGSIDGVTPSQIRSAVHASYGITIDYTSSYRTLLAAQELVWGSPEDGYDKLHSYLYMIQQANPGTITHLQRDELNRFKYLFIALGASLAGFNYLRRVIVVDGSHLTGKYQGVLLVAAAQDANFQIFPVAFGIVDSENDDAWEWFFRRLSECISDQYALTIVSDRHTSIGNGCENVFPWASRGICYYHLQTNIVQKFKARDLLYLVKGAAYAYTVHDFDRYMAEIRRQNNALADYLVEADVRTWSRVHFVGDRYNIKTSNIAESINAALKKARGFPICFLVEFIRDKLSRWFCKRRAAALSLETTHSRGVECLLAFRKTFADKLNVQRIDGWKSYVTGGRISCVVDLERKSCDCRVFDVEKIPCEHAIAAAQDMKMDPASLVCPSYSKNSLLGAYWQNIYPKNDAVKPPENVECLPPVVRRLPGRQKKSRFKSWLEIAMKKGAKPRKQYTCSQCKQAGHTKPHCRWQGGGSN